MANRLSATIARLGPGNALLYWTDRVFARLTVGRARIHRYRFFAQPIPDKPLLPVRASSKTRVIELERGDEALVDLPRPLAVIDQRFDQGGVCLGAYVNDEFAGCLWYNAGGYLEDEVRCRYVPVPAGDAVWDYDVYVAPRFRMGRVFLVLWDAAFAHMRETGVGWSLSRVSTYNAASQSSHQRLGARPMGTATFLRIAGLQLMLSGLRRPRLHLSFTDRQTPSIHLRAAETP